MLRRHLPLSLLAFITFVSLTVTTSFAQFASTDFTRLNRFVQRASSSDSAMKAFRVGRDLIEDEEWQAAEKRFRDFLRDYPKHKEADAALYWLAFTQKKQAHFSEADQLLVKLINEYPKSGWVRDAKVMRAEIAPALGNVEYLVQIADGHTPRATTPRSVSGARAGQVGDVYVTTPVPQPAAVAPTPAGQDIVPPAPGAPVIVTQPPIPPGSFSIAGVDGVFHIGNQSSGMDEKDEIKAIALQSLMQSNPERALPYIADILKNNSTASKGLKESAVRLLGQYRGPNSTPLLIDLARNQTDSKLRRTAIYSLGNVDDQKVFDLLLDIATKSDDQEVAKAALRALANHRNQRAKDMVGNLALSATSPFIRRDAISWLGERSDDASVDKLIRIYDSESDPEIKKHAIYALSRSSNVKARQKLLDIVRSNTNEDVRVQAIQWLSSRNNESYVDEMVKIYQADKSPKVRKQVIFSLSQMASHGVRYVVAPGQRSATVWSFDALTRAGNASGENSIKAVKALLQLYDAESDEAMKSQMLFAFSQSRSKEGLQKLMQVAKTDASMTLRKKAIVYLGQSNDPESSKLLEEILK